MGIMNLAEILDNSIEVLKKYIKTIAMFMLGYGVIMYIMIFGLILVGGIFTAVTISFNIGLVLPVILISIAVLFIAAFSASSSIGVIKISSQELIGEKVKAYGAVAESFKNILKLVGIIIVGLVLFIPAIIVFGTAIYLLYKAFGGSLITIGKYGVTEVLLIIVSIIVTLAAVFVVLLYFTVFSFTLHALVIEKKGVIGSVKRSYELVKGSFWKMFGALVILTLTIYAITASLESFLGVILGIIYLFLNFLNVQPETMTFLISAYSIARWPLNLLAWLLISPMGIIMTTLLYFNVRSRKEGFDMLLKLREIQKNDERKQAGESIEYSSSNGTGI
jgi:hypothetical protein